MCDGRGRCVFLRLDRHRQTAGDQLLSRVAHAGEYRRLDGDSLGWLPAPLPPIDKLLVPVALARATGEEAGRDVALKVPPIELLDEVQEESPRAASVAVRRNNVHPADLQHGGGVVGRKNVARVVLGLTHGSNKPLLRHDALVEGAIHLEEMAQILVGEARLVRLLRLERILLPHKCSRGGWPTGGWTKAVGAVEESLHGPRPLGVAFAGRDALLELVRLHRGHATNRDDAVLGHVRGNILCALCSLWLRHGHALSEHTPKHLHSIMHLHTEQLQLRHRPHVGECGERHTG